MRSKKQTERQLLLMESSLAYPRGKEEKSRNSKGRLKLERRADTRVSYRGRDRSRRINLWLHNGHYDIIKSLKGFYGTNNYCETRDKPFQDIEDHRCDNACHVCLRVNRMQAQPQRCGDCDRERRSAKCLEAHKAISGQQEYSICGKDTFYF
ncbi:hypothetical protein AVEN_56489-1 [Araneus ventricosus]|nr:hypothetical protein AVEN_263095-1 [Araneus ventricosus]GBN99212.1 hypothetical protein AVEN_12056-1 [Araneus ventricosus]GBN99403.1 hypothetical protein AVEN_56489-1 [Araneus ventricosus]